VNVRPPVIAVFDLDRTITTHGTFSPWLLRFLKRHPWRAIALPVILIAAIGYKLKLLGRKELKQVMLKCMVRGLPASEIAEVTAGFVADWVPGRCRPGALSAIATHHASGDIVVLATASNDIHAVPIAKALGIARVVATRTELEADGSLSGRILGPNCYGADKLTMVKDALTDIAAPGKTYGYSDHHTDLPLLDWATEGVAVNPNGKLRAAAAARGMAVVDWGKP